MRVVVKIPVEVTVVNDFVSMILETARPILELYDLKPRNLYDSIKLVIAGVVDCGLRGEDNDITYAYVEELLYRSTRKAMRIHYQDLSGELAQLATYNPVASNLLSRTNKVDYDKYLFIPDIVMSVLYEVGIEQIHDEAQLSELADIVTMIYGHVEGIGNMKLLDLYNIVLFDEME